MHPERQKPRIDVLVDAVALDVFERVVNGNLDLGASRVDAE